MEDSFKEVYFDQYCSSCRFFNIPEEKDPCNICLANPANLNSHKPTEWKKKEN